MNYTVRILWTILLLSFIAAFSRSEKLIDIQGSPWQVGIVKLPLRNRLCGGSIVNERFIITTARCVHKGKHETKDHVVVLKDDLEHRRVEVPRPRRLEDRDNWIYVRKIYIHPDFDATTLANDLALLEVDGIINFENGNNSPICLPDKSSLSYVGTYVSQSGFGRLPVTFGPNLMSLPSKNLLIKRFSNCEDPRKICAVNKFFPFETCKADEGGSVSFNYEEQNILVGLVSTGSQMCPTNNSDGEEPGIYIRIAYYIEWILETTKGVLTCVPYRTFQDQLFQTY